MLIRTCMTAASGAAVALALLCGTDRAEAASANVAALQVALGAVGISPGPIDGITGPRTTRAVRRFQDRKGLDVDGIAGPQTRHALGRRGRPSLGSRPLHTDQQGWDVASLQFLLHTRGYGPGGFDGGFGPNTHSAVERFQRAAGLAADGVAGPLTLDALRHRQLSAPADGGSGTSPSGPVAFLRPISGTIGDGFGYPDGRRHTGIDIPSSSGTPVGAAGRGTVSFAGYNDGGYGNLVVITHRLGFESWYAHLSSISVSAGDAVAGGVVIGRVGSTGHSTGPHLHFEVRHFGTPIDPVPRLLDAVSARRAAHAAARSAGCRPNADTWGTRDTDPPVARLDRCP